MNIIIWLSVPIAFAFGIMTAWMSSALLMLAMDSVLSDSLSWIQNQSWLYTTLTSALLCLGCMIGAANTVLLPAMSAPKYKKETAYLALILGAAMSAIILFSILSWAIFIPVYLAMVGSGIYSVIYLEKLL